MADDAEDVLELDDDQVIDETEDRQSDDEEQQDESDDTPDDDEDGETVFTFDGEEAAPASESESSVIREMRQKLRERDRELADLKRGSQPERIEVGDKPSLESCEYDEDRFETELDAWKERKAKAERAERERGERVEKEREAWAKIHRAYEADKASTGIPDFENAEAEVAANLPEATRALLLKSGKGAQLIAALHRSPTKLEELSKLDPTDAAMMIGELRSKLQMSKRTRPDPDRPVRGNAAPTSADKELARLEKEAERTGNRSELIAYRKKLKSRA